MMVIEKQVLIYHCHVVVFSYNARLHDSGLLGGVCIYISHHYLQKWAII